MKLLVMTFPASALILKIIPHLDFLNEPLCEERVWYDDLIPACQRLIDEYKVDEIFFFGNPQNYIDGFINQFDKIFNIPISYIG